MVKSVRTHKLLINTKCPMHRPDRLIDTTWSRHRQQLGETTKEPAVDNLNRPSVICFFAKGGEDFQLFPIQRS